MEQALEVQHLSKRYGKVLAIRDVSLTIEKGRITALVGPNGAGKTTILNVISGLETPDEGTIYMSGMLVTDPRQLRRACTLVFQRATVFTATVFENVAYGLKIRGASKPEIERRVEEALTLTKLKPYTNRRARSLSGGESQRLSIARALTLLPEVKVLMLDEPNANLDRESVAILEAVLRYLAKEHVTMVMTTHQLDRLIGFADKVALVKDGTIQAEGGPEDILSNFSPMQMGNYVRGVAEPTEHGTSMVSAEAIKIEVSGRMTGPVTLRVDPRSILVLREMIQSSARNVFKGTIEEASVLGDLVQLKVNIGRPFIVHLTRSSYASMKLNIGEKVCIAFKATSIDVI